MHTHFPHDLAHPYSGLFVKEGIARVVNDNKLFPGDEIGLLIKGHDGTWIRASHKIMEVVEERPARGNWSGWPTHPFFYQIKVVQVIQASKNPFE